MVSNITSPRDHDDKNQNEEAKVKTADPLGLVQTFGFDSKPGEMPINEELEKAVVRYKGMNQYRNQVLKLPYNNVVVVCQESGAPDQPNNALELYMQFVPPNETKSNAERAAKDIVYLQACVDLMVAIMEEPIYNELRTKQQLGYSVGIGVRDTHGVPGLSIQI